MNFSSSDPAVEWVPAEHLEVGMQVGPNVKIVEIRRPAVSWKVIVTGGFVWTVISGLWVAKDEGEET